MRELFIDLETSRPDIDPIEAARKDQRRELPRRFYKTVAVGETPDGFGIELDGRPVRSPAGAALLLPTSRAAGLIAAEFEAQAERIDPVTMPVWRLVNTAIEGVAADTQPVMEDIMRFASSDLLCYRADSPRELVERQNEHWDPVLEWARTAFGARFMLAEGVMHVDQPRETIGAVGIHLAREATALRLAALHLMTSLTGSALLALATDAGFLTTGQAWAAAHVDEDWNIDQWGADEEATARREVRERDFLAAVAFLQALRG
jgi:chaperone required for assembly of F1-ATPase